MMNLPSNRIVVCLPVYNDWESALLLLHEIDRICTKWSNHVEVLFVDDGSVESAPSGVELALTSLVAVRLLRLRRNVGHQRAIAIGLASVWSTDSVSHVVVMDADGEDACEDVEALLSCCVRNSNGRIVFAKRRKRTEGLSFRFGYFAFRWLHRLLTGRPVNIGNFSVIPEQCLNQVVGVSEIWNHYSAGVMHARLPYVTVPIDRAQRLRGMSKMSFVSLVTHGMSAMSVYGDVVGVRLLSIVSSATVCVVGALLAIPGIRAVAAVSIPAWAMNLMMLSAVLLVNLLMLSLVFVFIILQSRAMAGFLPVRDWQYYVATSSTIYDASSSIVEAGGRDCS